MGIIDRLKAFGRRGEKRLIYPETLSGAWPVFSQFGQVLYKDETIQACINVIAGEMKKLSPHHVRGTGQTYSIIEDSYDWVLQHPNSRMTTADFIEYVVWQLYLNFNAFIIPYYDEAGRLTMLYPLPQGSYSIMTGADGIDYLTCEFNGVQQPMVFIYDRVIHLRKQYSVNEWMGGNEQGNPDIAGLTAVSRLNLSILNGVKNSIEMSQQLRGFFMSTTHMKEETLAASKKQLQELWQADGSVFGILGQGFEYKELKRDVKIVDAETLKFLDKKILRAFGISEAMLSGDYTKAQYEAFYQSTIEPLVVSFGQAFTKALFSDREKQVGNRVRFFENFLEFMTTSEKLDFARLAVDQGVLFANEFRSMFGLKPLPDSENVRMQSLNYIQSQNALQYQTKELRGANELSLTDQKE